MAEELKASIHTRNVKAQKKEKKWKLFYAQFYAHDSDTFYQFRPDFHDFFFTLNENSYNLTQTHNHSRSLLTGISNGGGVEQIHARAGQR